MSFKDTFCCSTLVNFSLSSWSIEWILLWDPIEGMGESGGSTLKSEGAVSIPVCCDDDRISAGGFGSSLTSMITVALFFWNLFELSVVFLFVAVAAFDVVPLLDFVAFDAFFVFFFCTTSLSLLETKVISSYFFIPYCSNTISHLIGSFVVISAVTESWTITESCFLSFFNCVNSLALILGFVILSSSCGRIFSFISENLCIVSVNLE